LLTGASAADAGEGQYDKQKNKKETPPKTQHAEILRERRKGTGGMGMYEQPNDKETHEMRLFKDSMPRFLQVYKR
jgi:hypothetical protein